MKTAVKLLATAALLASSALAMAADKQAKKDSKPPFTPEEISMLQFCDSSSFGLVLLADMRQRGLSKADATKELDAVINAINNSTEDKEVAKQLGDFWKMNIDGMWETKVYDTDADKRGFVQAVYQQSMGTCISDLKKGGSAN